MKRWAMKWDPIIIVVVACMIFFSARALVDAAVTLAGRNQVHASWLSRRAPPRHLRSLSRGARSVCSHEVCAERPMQPRCTGLLGDSCGNYRIDYEHHCDLRDRWENVDGGAP